MQDRIEFLENQAREKKKRYAKEKYEHDYLKEQLEKTTNE
jgi:hypothetical protein